MSEWTFWIITRILAQEHIIEDAQETKNSLEDIFATLYIDFEKI